MHHCIKSGGFVRFGDRHEITRKHSENNWEESEPPRVVYLDYKAINLTERKNWRKKIRYNSQKKKKRCSMNL